MKRTYAKICVIDARTPWDSRFPWKFAQLQWTLTSELFVNTSKERVYTFFDSGRFPYFSYKSFNKIDDNYSTGLCVGSFRFSLELCFFSKFHFTLHGCCSFLSRLVPYPVQFPPVQCFLWAFCASAWLVQQLTRLSFHCPIREGLVKSALLDQLSENCVCDVTFLATIEECGNMPKKKIHFPFFFAKLHHNLACNTAFRIAFCRDGAPALADLVTAFSRFSRINVCTWSTECITFQRFLRFCLSPSLVPHPNRYPRIVFTANHAISLAFFDRCISSHMPQNNSRCSFLCL